MISGRVRHNGDEIARSLRRAGGKLRRGLAGIGPSVASRTVSAGRSRGGSLGGVHRHVVPGIGLRGPATVSLDGRRQPAIFGAVYGGGNRPTTRQFPPFIGRTGRGGYMVIPELRIEQARAERIVDDLIDRAF
jgi:hypothetical protein